MGTARVLKRVPTPCRPDLHQRSTGQSDEKRKTAAKARRFFSRIWGSLVLSLYSRDMHGGDALPALPPALLPCSACAFPSDTRRACIHTYTQYMLHTYIYYIHTHTNRNLSLSCMPCHAPLTPLAVTRSSQNRIHTQQKEPYCSLFPLNSMPFPHKPSRTQAHPTRKQVRNKSNPHLTPYPERTKIAQLPLPLSPSHPYLTTQQLRTNRQPRPSSHVVYPPTGSRPSNSAPFQKITHTHLPLFCSRSPPFPILAKGGNASETLWRSVRRPTRSTRGCPD